MIALEPPPPLAREWRLLADAAARLLADREAAYPRLVDAGKMTADAAAIGLAAMRVLTLQWRALLAMQPFDLVEAAIEHGVAPRQCRLQIEAAARTSAARAASAPDDERWQEYAQAVAALAWHQQPHGADSVIAIPRVLMVHGANLMHAARPHARAKVAA